jgi:uncharacterized protein YlaI
MSECIRNRRLTASKQLWIFNYPYSPAYSKDRIERIYDNLDVMSSRCVLCDISFSSDEGREQHKRDSPAHEYDCTSCDRHFGSDQALEQHKRDSPAHKYKCTSCDRHFSSDTALQQHLRDSPLHAPEFECETCDRSFDSEKALEQHLQDSPAHTPSFECKICDRSFNSESALEQHLRDSPAHAPSFDCKTCDRSFDSESALEQHLRDSPVHQQAPDTPLDLFFRSFWTFEYDPALPPATSYAYLQEHEGWRRGEAASKDAWNQYQDALEGELRMWYGAENDLAAWHALCRAIGVEPLPQRCEQCEKV